MKKSIKIILVAISIMCLLCSCATATPVNNTATETTQPTQQTTETTTEPILLYVVDCQESITLFLTPSLDAAEITQIPFGTAVYFIEDAGDGFYKVRYNAEEGYSLSKYLSKTPKEKVTTTVTTINTDNLETFYVANCKKSITLRTSPSVSASEITQMPLGAEVKFVEVSDNGFYKIVYKGQVGYALSNYLSQAGCSNDNYYYMRVVNCKECISLRSAPTTSASKICDIDLGETVYFIRESENGFYQIAYNGKTGYALSSYLEWE